jgi:hypothetical protein
MLATVVVAAPMAHADRPGEHPAYLHALTDLRHARALLYRPANTRRAAWDESKAVFEIDESIREIKEAAIDDGKNLDDHPPIDERMEWGGRPTRRWCRSAGDRRCSLQRRALQHMDMAATFIEQGIADSHRVVEQPRHPAYLRALEDLRLARAFLYRRDNERTEWDEKRAVHQIDEAIREIKEASIDDGKNIDDHPPIDTNVEWGGRLRKSLELVRKARADVNEEEDNQFARGLQARALEHIDRAVMLIEDGIANSGRGHWR